MTDSVADSGARRATRGLRTLAIMHLAELSGPARIMRPRLERIACGGRLDVVVPGAGRTADTYVPIAEAVVELAYEPLVFARTPTELASMMRARSSELRRFRALIRRARPDLVVIATATLPAALLAARIERVPAIVEVMEIFEKGHIGGRARGLAGAAITGLHRRLADALVCCSHAVADQFPGTGRALVRTIYPGISPEHAEGDPERLRGTHGLEDASPLIAVIGHVSRGRGQDLLIRALPEIAASFPRAACAIVGAPHPRSADLDFRDGLERLADELGVGDRVRLTGFVDPVADVYAAADIVVNPARFNEPFGQVAPEALVGGCPVVATRVGGIPEVLRDERDTLLVPPEDPPAIAAAVIRLAGDPDLARRLLEEGRRHVLAEFTQARSVDAFERLTLEVVERRARSGGSDPSDAATGATSALGRADRHP